MDLVYKNEKTLFAIMLVLSVIVWLGLIVGTFGGALVYLLAFFVAYLFAQSALIAYLRGTGVKVTEQQFPDLHARVEAACAKLEMENAPEAYVLHMGGAFNAFATRFLGRNFIVLYSDIVDALEDQPDALNFYIGHEIGHLKRKHLTWGTVLAPASILPLIGAAYHRAREYTCDRHGLAACADPASAQFGLAALAAGGKRWRTMSKTNYIAQSEASSGFWMSFHELVGDYPWLVKRMAAVRALAEGKEPDHPSRNPIAYLLALLVPRFGVAGGAGAIVVIAMIGVLAAVAIPAYQDYTVKAKVYAAYAVGSQATKAVENYYYANGEAPPSLADAGMQPVQDANVAQVEVNAQNAVVMVTTTVISPTGQGQLMFEPRLDEQKKIRWTCRAVELRPAVLPKECH